jgi:hypothetical protein
MYAKIINNVVEEISSTDYNIDPGELWVPLQKHFYESNGDLSDSLVGNTYLEEDGTVLIPQIFVTPST